MMPILLILLVPAVILFVVWQWRSRQQLFKLLDAQECRLCGTPLDEALYDYLGRPSAADVSKLDKFQATYAKYKIRCGSCGGTVICADNGVPMSGYYDTSL